MAFRFHQSFLRSVLGQVEQSLHIQTSSLLLGLSFESNIHVVHYRLLIIYEHHDHCTS